MKAQTFNHAGVNYQIEGDFTQAMSHFHEVRAHLFRMNLANVNNLPILSSVKEFDDGTTASFSVVDGRQKIEVFAPVPKPPISKPKGGEKPSRENDDDHPVPVFFLDADYLPTHFGQVVLETDWLPIYYKKGEEPIIYEDIDREIHSLKLIGTRDRFDGRDNTTYVGSDTGWNNAPQNDEQWDVDLHSGVSGLAGPNLAMSYWLPGSSEVLEYCPGAGTCPKLSHGDLLFQYTSPFGDIDINREVTIDYLLILAPNDHTRDTVYFYERYGIKGTNWSLVYCDTCVMCLMCDGETWVEGLTDTYWKWGETQNRSAHVEYNYDSGIYDFDTGASVIRYTGSEGQDATAMAEPRFKPLDVTVTRTWTDALDSVWVDVLESSKVMGVEGYEDHKYWIVIYQKERYIRNSHRVTIDGVLIEDSTEEFITEEFWVSICGDEYLLDSVSAPQGWCNYDCYATDCAIYDFNGEPVYVFGFFKNSHVFIYGMYFRGKMNFSPEFPEGPGEYRHEAYPDFHKTGVTSWGDIGAAAVKEIYELA